MACFPLQAAGRGLAAGLLRPVATLVLLAVLVAGLNVPSGMARAEAIPFAYSACVMFREGQGEARQVGSVTTFGRDIRLDVDLGAPGLFHALLRPERKTLYVVSDALKAYVEIPVQGDERDVADMAQRLAASVMPFGVPVLGIQATDVQTRGSGMWQGYPVEKTAMRFVADFMGNTGSLNLVLWDNPAFAPLPLRVEEVGTKGEAKSCAELVDIEPVSPTDAEWEKSAALFELPAGYTRYSSVLDLLLYALAAS